MKKTKRSSIILITSLAVAVLLMVSLTLAYLTDFRSTLNVLGIGQGGPSTSGAQSGKRTVMIELTEEKFAAQAVAEAAANNRSYSPTLMNPGTPHEYEKVELYDIVPGMTVNKDSTVGNIGSGRVFVRFRLLRDTTPYTYDTFASELNAKLGLEINEKWEKCTGGDNVNYYYTNNTGAITTLEPGASVPCFETKTQGSNEYTFMIPSDKTNSDLAVFANYLNLVVYAEAIQGAYFTPGALTAADPWDGCDAIQAAIR